MTGEQLIVLGLLAAAFAAGWIAGTANDAKRPGDAGQLDGPPPPVEEEQGGNGRDRSSSAGRLDFGQELERSFATLGETTSAYRSVVEVKP